MDHTHMEIWDYLYRSGPQTVEQIAHAVGFDAATVNAAVCHEWFEIADSKVRIAMKKPPHTVSGSIG